jgi:hypothetical protein
MRYNQNILYFFTKASAMRRRAVLSIILLLSSFSAAYSATLPIKYNELATVMNRYFDRGGLPLMVIFRTRTQNTTAYALKSASIIAKSTNPLGDVASIVIEQGRGENSLFDFVVAWGAVAHVLHPQDTSDPERARKEIGSITVAQLKKAMETGSDERRIYSVIYKLEILAGHSVLTVSAANN